MYVLGHERVSSWYKFFERTVIYTRTFLILVNSLIPAMNSFLISNKSIRLAATKRNTVEKCISQVGIHFV